MNPEDGQNDDPEIKVLLDEAERRSDDGSGGRGKLALMIILGAGAPLVLILLALVLSLFAGPGVGWIKGIVGFAIFVGIGLVAIFSWYFANRE